MLAHLKYLRYVLIHKWYVYWACRALGVGRWQAFIHDWQKFLPVEWFPYVQNFYGGTPIKRDKSGYYNASAVGGAFDYAWLHHQHLGPHHWQHWILRQDDGDVRALRMPERFIREMVGDWIGAGKAQGTPDCFAWFTARRVNNQIVLHPDNLTMVLWFLEFAQREGLIP